MLTKLSLLCVLILPSFKIGELSLVSSEIKKELDKEKQKENPQSCVKFLSGRLSQLIGTSSRAKFLKQMMELNEKNKYESYLLIEQFNNSFFTDYFGVIVFSKQDHLEIYSFGPVQETQREGVRYVRWKEKLVKESEASVGAEQVKSFREGEIQKAILSVATYSRATPVQGNPASADGDTYFFSGFGWGNKSNFEAAIYDPIMDWPNPYRTMAEKEGISESLKPFFDSTAELARTLPVILSAASKK